VQGIEKATRDLPIEQEKIEELVDAVCWELASWAEEEVHSAYIGKLVLDRLKPLNPIAYLRFAAYYEPEPERLKRRFEEVLSSTSKPTE